MDAAYRRQGRNSRERLRVASDVANLDPHPRRRFPYELTAPNGPAGKPAASKVHGSIDPGQPGLSFLADAGKSSRTRSPGEFAMFALDVMRTSFATIKPGAPLLDAVRLLLETGQRGLPVLDGSGALVGVISEGDFLHRRELGVHWPEGFWLEWLLSREEGRLVRERTRALSVDAVMSRKPVCVDECATVDEIVAEMDKHQILQVMVLRDTRVVGIVGRAQLLLALERILSRSDGD
ncbi:CBS domain-containing protein [Bradyrhizobium sp. BRP56]|uniref:CBS domain-containing protein n=1 Tax=Bradyrhizobium sp. BRP56 TaxID=2793819 RepID=UPI001CD2C2AA|nr:CBS domain-containing protein [Bradyrhizobium sp. BRP56]